MTRGLSETATILTSSLHRLRHDLFIAAPVTGDRPRPATSAYLTFAALILIHIGLRTAFEPALLSGPSMWAEMATNYFPNARSPFWLERLFATDAGYIPLPQRLLSQIPVLLGLRAGLVPFVYAWSAVVGTAIMVGAFTLPAFRVVIESDAMRFACGFVILLCADFETQTYINFTYFAAFFIAVATALALCEPSDDVPRWMWVIPILVMSKPAVMAALPAMLAAAFVCKRRFRWIAGTSLVLCFIQIARLLVSQAEGTLPQGGHAPLMSKILATVGYVPAMLAAYVVGPHWARDRIFLLALGCAFLLALVLMVWRLRRRPQLALIACGVSLLSFTLLLDCMTLSDTWNMNLRQVIGPQLYRHIIVGFFGCVMIVCGVCDLLGCMSPWSPDRRKAFAYTGILLFLMWFAGSGWLAKGFRMQTGLRAPIVGNSQWDIMAAGIDDGQSPLCIPIDPLNWMFGAGCVALNQLPYDLVYETSGQDPRVTRLDYAMPSGLSERSLSSLGVLVLPNEGRQVQANATLEMQDGRKLSFRGGRFVRKGGGLVVVPINSAIPVSEIAAVHFEIDGPIDVAFQKTTPPVPAILLLGH